MRHSAFEIGYKFMTPAGRWRCTDTGTCAIMASGIDLAETMTLLDGHQVRRYLAQEEAEIEGCLTAHPTRSRRLFSMRSA